jgi:hypothetical protein
MLELGAHEKFKSKPPNSNMAFLSRFGLAGGRGARRSGATAGPPALVDVGGRLSKTRGFDRGN